MGVMGSKQHVDHSMEMARYSRRRQVLTFWEVSAGTELKTASDLKVTLRSRELILSMKWLTRDRKKPGREGKGFRCRC